MSGIRTAAVKMGGTAGLKNALNDSYPDKFYYHGKHAPCAPSKHKTVA
jgi:hypothetical protein